MQLMYPFPKYKVLRVYNALKTNEFMVLGKKAKEKMAEE